MRRLGLVSLAAGLLLVSLASPVAAARTRVQIPVGDLDLTIDAGFCGFPVSVEDVAGSIVESSMQRKEVFDDRYTWRTVTRLTNVDDPANWIQISFHSVVRATTHADGSTTIQGINDGIVWYADGDPSELPAGVWLISHGRFTEEYDASGALLQATLQAGKVTDICAALS